MNVIKYPRKSLVVEKTKNFNFIDIFQILAMYVIKYFDLVVCFEKIINF